MADNNATEQRRTRGHLFSVFVVLTLLTTLLTPLAGTADEVAHPDPKFRPSTDNLEIPEIVQVTGKKGKWLHLTTPFARIYGNGQPEASGVVVIAGGSIEDVCNNNLPPMLNGKVRQHWDSSWELRLLKGQRLPTYVYKTDLDVIAFFGASCGGFFEAGIPLPAAFAHGSLTIRDRVSRYHGQPLVDEAPAPGSYWKNQVSGFVYDEAGNRYRLRALAEYTVAPTGEPDFIRDFITFRKLGK